MDYVKIFDGNIKLAKQFASIPPPNGSKQVVTTLPAPRSKGSAVIFSGSNMPTNSRGFGVMFFPPVWIDKKPEQNLTEQVMHSPLFRKKAFDIEFSDKKLIFNTDGFIGIEGENKEEAMKIFNTFFGVAHLYGVFCFAVNEDDIADITIDKNKMEIGGMTMQGHSERMQLIGITQDSKKQFKIQNNKTRNNKANSRFN